jgi:hypothetical protein
MNQSEHGENYPHKREFLLASMRVAGLNLKSWAAEIDMIGVALRSDHISLEDACAHLHGMGVLRWFPDNGGAPS